MPPNRLTAIAATLYLQIKVNNREERQVFGNVVEGTCEFQIFQIVLFCMQDHTSKGQKVKVSRASPGGRGGASVMRALGKLTHSILTAAPD